MMPRKHTETPSNARQIPSQHGRGGLVGYALAKRLKAAETAKREDCNAPRYRN